MPNVLCTAASKNLSPISEDVWSIPWCPISSCDAVNTVSLYFTGRTSWILTAVLHFKTPPLSSLSLSHTCISHFVSLVRDLSCWPLGFVPDCRSRTITNALIFFLGSTNSFSWNGQKCWVINLYILSYKRHEPYHVSAFFSMHYLIMVPISTDIIDNLSALLFYLPG